MDNAPITGGELDHIVGAVHWELGDEGHGLCNEAGVCDSLDAKE